MLKELPRLLYEHYMIENSHMVERVQDDPSTTTSTALTLVTTPDEQRLLFDDASNRPEAKKSSSMMSWKHIRWAARTKKRVERLIASYEDWLHPIRKLLEECWWPLSFFDKYVNLRTLEDDQDC